MYSTYLFDFDGTLVNSMPTWSAGMLNILKKNNVTYPDDIIKTIVPLGNLGGVKYFRDVLKVNMSTERMLSMMDAYVFPKYRDEISLKDGVLEYLTMLKKNNCSLNVLTASPHKMLDPCLKRNGVYDLFDNVWSCEDFKLTKADPEIYRQAAKVLNVGVDEVAFFDDNIGAIKTAAKAGMYTVAVYDKSGEGFKNELEEISDLYVDTFVGLDII